MDLSIQLKGNRIASWCPISVSSREMEEASTALDWLLKLICDVDRAAARKALGVLALRKKEPQSVTDEEAVKAYFTLKDMVTEDCNKQIFWASPDSGFLGIDGPDESWSFSMRVTGNTLNEYLLMRRWDEIAGVFDASNQEAARDAFFKLVRANNAAAQLSAFTDLIRSARADQRGALTWQISGGEPPHIQRVPSVFRIGELDVPCRDFSNVDAADGAVNAARDTSLLLCAVRYDEMDVVSQFHALPASGGANSELEAQLLWLRQTPQLINALMLMGLYTHTDGEANLSTSGDLVAQTVGTMCPDEGSVERRLRNAKDLLTCARQVRLLTCGRQVRLEREASLPDLQAIRARINARLAESDDRNSDVSDSDSGSDSGSDSDSDDGKHLLRKPDLSPQELQTLRDRANRQLADVRDSARI